MKNNKDRTWWSYQKLQMWRIFRVKLLGFKILFTCMCVCTYIFIKYDLKGLNDESAELKGFSLLVCVFSNCLAMIKY
jgi:hypothetical protein